MRAGSFLFRKMASPFGVCRLCRSWPSGGVLNSLHKTDRLLSRNLGIDVAVAQTEGRHDESEEKGGFKDLQAVQAERQEQAERSVLISYHSKIREKTFLKFVSRHGDIKKYFYYESYGIYALVEFARRESVASLLEDATIPTVKHECMLPFKSRLLLLKNLSAVDQASQQPNLPCKPQSTIPISKLLEMLSMEESIDQQMTSLTQAYQITEENTCLRYLVCSLLKDIAAAYFPECTIKPFGSSVNGFGKLGSDLDMFLDLDAISGRKEKQSKSGLSLSYQMKQVKSERTVTQRILSVLGECVDQFGPGCVGVQKILHARCPLVRFAHQPSGFHCDLTANNRVAMKTTELLYLYGELDHRVRCLIFTIRCWARVHNITSSIPGAWISNFSLTVMVLFFLQKRNPPIIPALNHLQELAGPADKMVIEGNDCTFVSDSSKIQLQKNTETLEQLLFEFFDFYATFAFNKMSVNIRKGTEQNKPEVAALHIQNPFEQSLNVSKNVNNSQLDRFVTLCQESSWLLHQSENQKPKSVSKNNTVAPWGLSALLLPTHSARSRQQKKSRQATTERIGKLLEYLKMNQNQTNDS
ncbi:poly(A) RNA polymerase, mitochondrial [Thalassophryne amazonica]|uniref:poly(A) RNA polymerase, mitochondrial n=1 Tax=Thalassophryne amazonica TaxID=390379 RepID=UPI001471407E|nr:poly(A) RNA polymerase, mitochondrial [Thalassophryne amazonica]